MPNRKPKAATTSSLTVSLVLHGLVFLVIFVWAAKTGRLDNVLRTIGVVPQKREQPKTEQKETAQKAPSNTPKQIQQPQPQTSSGPASRGTRRAVASDAPDSAGGNSFFEDTRQQVQGGVSTPGREGGDGTGRALTAAPPPPPQVWSMRPSGGSSIKTLFRERQKAAAATESFGSEQISKSGVSSASDIVNKVAGATVVDGKFAVIRGLSERYVTTSLNGAEVPSADPYRKSASLDLFPAQVIDQVVITKTFTPDQPGTYTGGGINVVTKSFPEKPFISFSMGTSYNTQASLNENFQSYQGGATDWLGMDDGTRSISPSLSDQSFVVPQAPANTGVPTLRNPTRPNPAYQQNLNNANLLLGLTREMGATQFAPESSESPLNHNFSLSAGETTHLFKSPFGVFAGMTYNRSFSYYEDGVSRRYTTGLQSGSFGIRREGLDSRSVEDVNWAGVVNLAYQPLENHEFGFNFLYNQNSENLSRTQVSTTTDDPGVTFYQNRLHFTERNLNTYQLKGGHNFPELLNLRVDWLGALSGTTQDEPDTRFFNYLNQGGSLETGTARLPDPQNPTRYFRGLDENNRNGKVDFTLPFRQWTLNEGQFKFGVYDSQSDRTFFDREVFYRGDAGFTNPNDYLRDDALGFTSRTNANGNIIYNWNRYLQTRDSKYTGDSQVQAGYLMFDVPVVEKLRLISGVRLETTDIAVDSSSYIANSITGTNVNSSVLSKEHLLPSIGAVVALNSKLNLRVNYSQTLARPAFRELAAYRTYDPVLDEMLEGNPRLQMSEVNNYDLRLEYFPRPGELFAVSIFSKDLKNAIEKKFITTDGEIVTYENRATAEVSGIEFEVRKGFDFLSPLLADFSFGGNLSLIQSEVPLTREELVARRSSQPDSPDTRSLFDQSPYIFNADLNYDNSRSGTSASLIFNIFGPRILIAGLNTPDVYEQPAPLLDFVISQRIARNWRVRFSARNLLDPNFRRSYGEDTPDLIHTMYRKGRTFGLSVGCEF